MRPHPHDTVAKARISIRLNGDSYEEEILFDEQIIKYQRNFLDFIHVELSAHIDKMIAKLKANEVENEDNYRTTK